MSEQNNVLMYKGKPLIRKDNMVYYGSMSDEYIVQLHILETTDLKDLKMATKVSVQIQRTDPNARSKDRILKKSEYDGFYAALEVGCIWLSRYNTKK